MELIPGLSISSLISTCLEPFLARNDRECRNRTEPYIEKLLLLHFGFIVFWPAQISLLSPTWVATGLCDLLSPFWWESFQRKSNENIYIDRQQRISLNLQYMDYYWMDANIVSPTENKYATILAQNKSNNMPWFFCGNIYHSTHSSEWHQIINQR